MSTRSNIAIKRKNGTYEKIYCHSDGYLEYNGVILDMFYKNIEKINNLLDLGDISVLGTRVNPDPSIRHGFDYNERQEGVTVAYGRDRNETGIDKKIYQDKEKFIKSFKDTWCEYVYLYDENNEEWLYSKIPFGSSISLDFKSLHNELDDRGLVDKLSERKDELIRRQVDFIYNFDPYEFHDVYESYEDAYFEVYDLFNSEKGTINFIKTNNDLLKYLKESDSAEMKKIYNDGVKLNEEITKYIKETYENNINNEIEV